MTYADVARSGLQLSNNKKHFSTVLNELLSIVPLRAQERHDNLTGLQIGHYYRVFDGIYKYVGYEFRDGDEETVWSDGADHLHGFVSSEKAYSVIIVDEVPPDRIQFTTCGSISQPNNLFYGYKIMRK